MARSDHPNNTWCPQCGYGISVDEEGCCISCGGDAMGEGVDAAVALLEWIAELEKRIAELEKGGE